MREGRGKQEKKRAYPMKFLIVGPSPRRIKEKELVLLEAPTLGEGGSGRVQGGDYSLAFKAVGRERGFVETAKGNQSSPHWIPRRTNTDACEI